MADGWSEEAVRESREAFGDMLDRQTAESVARYVVAVDALPSRDCSGLNHHYAMILAREYLRLLADRTAKGELDGHAPVDRQNGT